MRRVLIVEDERILLQGIQHLLELENFEVLTAIDGAEGITTAIAEHPDLILCDIAMPKKDGFDVLEAIRANPETAEIPFVFLTARAEEFSVKRGISLGANAYLVKPFEMDELLTTISRLLGQDMIS